MPRFFFYAAGAKTAARTARGAGKFLRPSFCVPKTVHSMTYDMRMADLRDMHAVQKRYGLVMRA